MSEPLTVAELITALSRIDPTRIVAFDTEAARFPAHLIGITSVSDEVPDGYERFPVVLSADSSDYIHGVEQPDWTDERPTEPGEYWLSIASNKRITARDAIMPVELKKGSTLGILGVFSHGTCLGYITPSYATIRIDGALWAPRETPADPFKVTE